ncbi:MAG: hypothetical protein LBH06_09450 [Rikenellaceae bacterium]|jgi:hypothetical protein|nr:hypothetical protein [Rikenellaceae bacterium]
MKKKFFFYALAAVALVAGLASCKGTNTNNGSAPVNDGSLTINAPVTVEAEFAQDAALIRSVKACVYHEGNEVPIATGSYSNGKLSITLPATLSEEYLRTIDDLVPASVIFSDHGVKQSPYAYIYAFDADGQKIGEFYLDGWDLTCTVYGQYNYFDRDCTINGTDDDENYDLSLKKGWNLAYAVYMESSSLLTTTKPSDITMQWSYYPSFY